MKMDHGESYRSLEHNQLSRGGNIPPPPLRKEEKPMCVIVTAVPGAMPEPYDILAMSEANPDGGGVSWWDGERLRTLTR